MDEGRRSGSASGEDRISGLPDELLHDILVRLRCAHAAARTSVLSRRWRHVWAHLPQLRLVAPREAVPASFINSVDAALGGYLAPTLEHLSISRSTEPQGRELRIPAGRIAPWLHFAAEHVVGELNLYLCVPQSFIQPEYEVIGEEAVLELPAFERTKRIDLCFEYAYTTWLRPQASGLFAVLTSLKIDGCVCMEGSDLTALVSTQCPCLTYLNLFIELIANFDILMHSNSLHTLMLWVFKTRRLELVAPRLEELTINDRPNEAHISAPKLVKVAWYAPYDPHLNRFVDAGRTLRILKTFGRSLSLTKRFNEVDELYLRIHIIFPDVATYKSFLNETNKLPKCKSFSIQLYWKHHALVPIMLHLLRSCSSIKKFRVDLLDGGSKPVPPCLLSCSCRLEESSKNDAIDLSSLEEVEITGFLGSHEEMELVEFVSSNARILKRLVINDRFCCRSKEAREKVHSLFHPNVRVDYCGFRG